MKMNVSCKSSGGSDAVILSCPRNKVCDLSLSFNCEPELCLETRDRFRFTRDGFIVIYTDGSCLGNGTADAVAGIGVYFGPENRYNISNLLPEPFSKTNNSAEIIAVLAAIDVCTAHSFTSVEIRTDSQFLISCLGTHLPVWKQNGWLTASRKPVKNRLEFESLERALDGFIVRLTHVKGHSTEVGNNKADFLARWATEGRRLRVKRDLKNKKVQ
jgi:ribonuclease HI